jgi:hypothetical protein
MEAVRDDGPRARRRVARRSTLRAILALGLAAAGGGAMAQRASPPGLAGPARTRPAELPLAGNLAADAATATRERIPIVLLFDRDNCPYCERALREYLVPMSREGRWRTEALFRQVEIDRTLPLVDFAGAATTHRELAARYGAELSPTVLVVDARGEPIGAPIVGLMTVDFYGAYLENAFEAGVERMRGTGRGR